MACVWLFVVGHFWFCHFDFPFIDVFTFNGRAVLLDFKSKWPRLFAAYTYVLPLLRFSMLFVSIINLSIMMVVRVVLLCLAAQSGRVQSTFDSAICEPEREVLRIVFSIRFDNNDDDDDG